MREGVNMLRVRSGALRRCLLSSALLVPLTVLATAQGASPETVASLRLNSPSTSELIVVLDPTADPAGVALALSEAGFPTMSKIDAVPDRFHYRRVSVTSTDAATLAKIRAVPGILAVRRTWQGPGTVAPILHTGEVLAKFHPGTDVQAMAAKYGATVERPISWLENGYVLRVPDTDTTDAMTVSIGLAGEQQTVYSHPNMFMKDFIQKDQVVIEDPLFPFQWHHNNTGQLTGGRVGADINSIRAWEITEGEGAVVSVIDDSVHKDHEDLKENYRIGWDAIDQDGDPTPAFPGEGHGTATSGLVAARSNNIGLRGVAPRAGLIGVRGLGATIDDLAQTFIFSEANGAHVISASWGIPAPWAPTIPPVLNTIFADAVKRVATQGRSGRGVLVCFSAGNLNMLMAFNRPTSAQPYVMGCGASMRDDTRSCFSSFGPELSVVAPGGGGIGCAYEADIATTDVQETIIVPDPLFQFPVELLGYNPAMRFVNFSGYVVDPTVTDFPDTAYTHTFNGTSASTPIIAGVGALVFSVNDSLTAREAKNLIEHTAVKITSPNERFDPVTGHNDHFGHGRVDAYQAVLAARAARSWPSPVRNIQNVGSQSLVRLFWSLPDWDGDPDNGPDEDVSGVLIVRAPAGQLNWAPTDGVVYQVGQNVAPGVVVVANDYLTALDQTGLPKGGFDYALYTRNAANYYSWGRRVGFTSSGAVSVPLASVQTSASTGVAPLQVHFAGGGIDESGIASIVWNFGDGSTGNGPTVDHTYTSPGQYTATLTVTNNRSQTARTTATINVLPANNALPVVTGTATPDLGTAPLITLFQASATDADGDTAIQYNWDFGDGSVASGQTVEHIYLDPGIYGVTLTATDSLGGQGMTSLLVTVNAETTTAGEVVGENEAPSAQQLPFCGGSAAGATALTAAGLCGLMALRRRR